MAVFTALLMCTAGLTVASADFAAAGCKGGNYSKNCIKVAKKPGKAGTKRKGGGGGNQSYQVSQSSSPTRRTGPSLEAIYRKKQKEYQRAAKAYQTALRSYRGCVGRLTTPVGFRANCGNAPKGPQSLPPIGRARLIGDPPPANNAPVITLTHAQAGAIAVARLTLTANAPGIGPDPKKNEWDMAAIGYPLWLWADGPTQVGPVSENVAGLSVSLTARVSKTVFRMGDGKSVTCQGGGTPYASWVQPGAKSPTCGYVYEKPSLPSKKYTVTAITYWDVTWTVNGFSGVETVPLIATRQLPVGELQAIVVR